MTDGFDFDDSRALMHGIYVDDSEGVAATVADVPVCPTCLRAFEPGKYGPVVCEDCFEEDIERSYCGGRRYVTEHGSKKHYSPLCPHVRGSQYWMTRDESCVYGQMGPCGTCGPGGRARRAVTDGGRDTFECDDCGDATDVTMRWRYLPAGQDDDGEVESKDLCPVCSTGKPSQRLFRAGDDQEGR